MRAYTRVHMMCVCAAAAVLCVHVSSEWPPGSTGTTATARTLHSTVYLMLVYLEIHVIPHVMLNHHRIWPAIMGFIRYFVLLISE